MEIERRKDYINLPVYAERWDNFMEMTKQYREELCAKIDKLSAETVILKESIFTLDKKIIKLPCETRKGWYQSISRQLAFLWLILGVYIVALFGIIIKVFAG